MLKLTLGYGSVQIVGVVYGNSPKEQGVLKISAHMRWSQGAFILGKPHFEDITLHRALTQFFQCTLEGALPSPKGLLFFLCTCCALWIH